MEIKEIWKPIEGYEGVYEISNMGRLRNAKGVIRKPQNNGNGYQKVFLNKDGKGKRFFIHRLVAKAFIPNPEGKPHVNHIDESRDNNVASNLEWVTRKENLNSGTVQKRKVEGMRRFYDNGGISRNCKRVRCVEKDKVYPSITVAAKETGAQGTNIAKCFRGERHTAGGYHWELE